jgi:hypothetical protein
MPATQAPQQGEPVTDGLADGEVPPMPDEDGPHDVPDDKVIEKTLPSHRGGDAGR